MTQIKRENIKHPGPNVGPKVVRHTKTGKFVSPKNVKPDHVFGKGKRG